MRAYEKTRVYMNEASADEIAASQAAWFPKIDRQVLAGLHRHLSKARLLDAACRDHARSLRGDARRVRACRHAQGALRLRAGLLATARDILTTSRKRQRMSAWIKRGEEPAAQLAGRRQSRDHVTRCTEPASSPSAMPAFSSVSTRWWSASWWRSIPCSKRSATAGSNVLWPWSKKRSRRSCSTAGCAGSACCRRPACPVR